jgi:hypothetical protein
MIIENTDLIEDQTQQSGEQQHVNIASGTIADAVTVNCQAALLTVR